MTVLDHCHRLREPNQKRIIHLNRKRNSKFTVFENVKHLKSVRTMKILDTFGAGEGCTARSFIKLCSSPCIVRVIKSRSMR